MIRRPPRSTLDRSSAASDVYKRQIRISLVHSHFISLIDPKLSLNIGRLVAVLETEQGRIDLQLQGRTLGLTSLEIVDPKRVTTEGNAVRCPVAVGGVKQNHLG